MADRETVIKRLERVSYYFKSLLAVGWQGDADIYREHMETVRMAINLLEEQPEIVRCEDCKYLYHLWWLDEKNEKKCYICNKHTFTGMREEEWFCADGERRDDDV